MRRHPRLDLLFVLQIAVVLLLPAGCAPNEHRALVRARAVSAAADRRPVEAGAVAEAAKNLEAANLTDARLRVYSTETVAAVHDAAASAAFHRPESENMVILEERALEEKLRRGERSPRDLKRMFFAYMGARMFDRAAALRGRFPDAAFPSMPDKFLVARSPMPGRPVYSVGKDWKTVELTSLALDHGARVVMLLFPGCPAAEAATEDLLADPVTARVLREQGVLITERFDAEGVAAWKRRFGLEAFVIARHGSDFPEFNFDSSPRFYFLRDGVVKSELTGWGGSEGPDGNRARWLSEMKLAGR